MRMVWLGLKRIGLFVVGFLVLYVLAGLILSYIPIGPSAVAEGKRPHRVYLHSNGVHLDVVFPLDLIPDSLLRQLTYAPTAKLLAFGWGDKGFYLDTPTWAELKASTAIKAMFLPSPTAMHVTEHRRVSSQWSYMELNDAQLAKLWRYISTSFRTNDGQIEELVGKGYTLRDRFYEANGNYSCFVTCNTWVNTALKRIGVRTAVWTPVDKGVLRYLPRVENTET